MDASKKSFIKVAIEIHEDTLAWVRENKWEDVSLESYIGAMVDNEVRRRSAPGR